MSLRVVLRVEAEAEFDAAFDWYERERSGLGIAFAAEVEQVFTRISSRPLLYEIVLGDVRKATVRRFNYVVFYRAHNDRVEVIAVFHGSRDPATWQGRV